MPAHYYVSGVVVTSAKPAYFQIMEEKDGKQVCIAIAPFHTAQGREPARRDADMIVRALNAVSDLPALLPRAKLTNVIDGAPSGYMESDRDFVMDNIEAAALILGRLTGEK
jgi:hypothetical protein